MISLISSNPIALLSLPCVTRRGHSRHVREQERIPARQRYCPKELNRWLGRWENEGGAIVAEDIRKRNTTDVDDTAADQIMKQTNHHHEKMIRFGEPLTSHARHRRRRYSGPIYNDRSPEVTAMNAHLRASRYAENRGRNWSNKASRVTSSGNRMRNAARSFLRLGDQYNAQARENFTREAMLFVLIGAASIWPIIHSIKAIAARG